MKKFKYIFSLLIITLSFFTACEIGLGAAVDTKSPEAELTSPVADAVIRDSFLIGGTWTDDGEIESIQIKLSKTDGYKEYGPFLADMVKNEAVEGAMNSGTWSYLVEPKDQIIDGTYEANIVIADTFGHSSTYVRQFSIDNTAPVLILQKPFTKTDVSDSSTFEYGQHFTFEGQVSDENNVSKIEINVYRDAEFKDFIKTITLTDLPSTINLDVAAFTEGQTNDYSDIYGYTSISQAEAENKLSAVRYCKVTTYDKAVRYPVEGIQTEEDLSGNKTTAYYIYDDINTAELLGKYKITDLYKMKNGNYNLDNTNRSVEEINLTLSILDSKKSESSKFKLNPKNNPTFSVSGKAAFTGDFEINTTSTITNKSNVVIDIKPGLDNYTIQKETLRPYLLPCDNKGKLLVEDKKENRIYLSEAGDCDKNGSSYKCSVVLSTGLHSEAFKGSYENTNSLLISNYYCFGMEGTDIMGKQIISNGLYAFKFESNDSLNTLTVQTSTDNKTWASNDIFYANNNTVIYVKGVATGSEPGISGLISVKLNGKTNGITSTVNIAERTLVDGYYKQPFTSTVKIADCSLENDQSYTLEISAGTPSTDIKPLVKFDNEVPVVVFGEPSPYDVIHKEVYAANENAETKYLNGKISFNINISDNDNVKSAKIEFKQQDGSGNWIAKNEFTKSITSGFANWAFTDVDTTLLADNSLLKLCVTAADRSGNEKTYESQQFIVWQESDKPTAVGAEDVSVLTTRAMYADKTFETNKKSLGGTLPFILYDDDGIKQISATMYTTDEMTTAICSSSTSIADENMKKKENFNFKISTEDGSSLSSGVYPVKLTIKDKFDKSNEYVLYVRIISPTPVLKMVSFDEEVSKITTRTDSVINPVRTVKKRFSITSSGYPFRVYRKVDDQEEVLINEALNANEYSDSLTITSPLESKEHTIEYRVLDVDDQEGTVSTIFYVDNEIPVINASSIIVPDGTDSNASNNTEGPTGDFEVAVAESNTEKYQSGIKTVNYKILRNTEDASTEGRDAKEFSHDNNWSTKVTYADYPALAEEGLKKIAIQAVDEVGNATDWIYKDFVFDKGSPEAEVISFFRINADDLVDSEKIVSADNYYGYKYSLKVKALDSYALVDADSENNVYPVVLTQKKKGTAEDYSDATVVKFTAYVPFADGFVKFENLPGKYTDATETATTFDGIEGGTEKDKAALGTYQYTVTVRDKAGKTKTSQPVTMTIDYDPPAINLTAPAYDPGNTVPVDGVTYTFKAEATDTGASGVESISYAFNDDGSIPSLFTANNSGSMSIRKSIGSGREGTDYDLYEGVHYIHIKAIDKAGNESAVITQKFDIDRSAPEITVGESSEYFTSTTVTLSGKITETNELSSFKVYKKSEWDAQNSSATPVYTFTIGSGTGNIPATPIDHSFTCELSDCPQGNNEFTFVAVDVKGKTTSVNKTIKIDTGKPVVDLSKVTIPSTSDTGNEYYTFNGVAASAVDPAPGYGVEHIYLGFSNDTATTPVDIVSTEAGTITKHSNDGSWSSTIEFASLSTFVNIDGEGNKTPAEGNKKIWLKAKDKAGNESEWSSAAFVYDVAYPEISETGVGSDDTYQISTFSLSGEVSDSYGVDTVKIVRKVALSAQPAAWPAGYYTDEKCDSAVAEGTAYADGDYYVYVTPQRTGNTWSYTYTIENGKSGNGNDLADGTYEFTVRVKDKAGKENTTIRTVKVDTTDPVITAITTTNPASQKIKVTVNNVENDWYNTRTINLSVTANDGANEIESVSYKNGEAWSDLVKQEDGSYKGNVTFEQDYSAEYQPKISFRVKDKAGNINGDDSTYKETLFYIDTTPPVINTVYDDLGNELTGEILINGTAAAGSTIDIFVVADDANTGVAGICAGETYNSVNASTTPESSGVNAGRYKVSVPKQSGVLKLVASDKVNKTEVYSPVTLKVDNRDPEIKITSPVLKADEINTSELNGYIEISAIVKDFLETTSNTEDGKLRSIDVSYSIADQTTGTTAPSTGWYKIKDSTDDITNNRVTNHITNKDGTDTADFFYSASAKDNLSIKHRFSAPGKLLAVNNDKLELTDETSTQVQYVWVKIVAEDQAKRSTTKTFKIKIDRDTDKPTIDFTNITLGSSMANGSNVWLENTTILQGTVTDDDGISSLQLSLNGTDWVSANLSNTNWTFDIQDFYGTEDVYREKKANGNHTIYFKAVDKENNIFTSKDAVAFDAVYISDGTDTYGNSTHTDSRLYVKPETLPPEVIINSARINIYGTEAYDTAFSKLSVGGSNHNFDVKFTATDENLLKTGSGVVTATAVCIPDGATNSCYPITGTVKAYKTVDDAPVEISDFTQTDIEYFIASFTTDSSSIKNDSTPGRKKAGEIEFTITAKDSYNRESSQKQKIKYDYANPEITFSEPSDSVISSGSITAYGSIDESSKLWYALSLSGTTKPSTNTKITTWAGKKLNASGNLVATTGASTDAADVTPAYKEISTIGTSSWYLYFDGTASANAIHDQLLLDFVKAAKVKNESNVICDTTTIQAQSFTEIVDVYLWIKAEDSVGNITESSHKIQVDSQGDRPVVEIAYPKQDGNTVGGVVNIYGSAEPKNNHLMQYVFVQMVSDGHNIIKDNNQNEIYNPTGKTFGKTGKETNIPFEITKDDLDYLAAAGYEIYNMKTYKANPTQTKWAIGSSPASGYTASDYGILIKTEGSTGWSLKINSNNEFDISGNTNPVGICVYAQDGDGYTSLRATRHMQFDSTSPIITDIFVKQYNLDGSEKASRKYEENMWLTSNTGDWYLTFTATDDEQINSVNVGSDVITSFETGSSDKTKKVKYKLPSSTFTQTITVSDNAEHSTTEDISINFDNTTPRISSSVSGFASSVQNSNGYYSMSSMVEESENESGVDYVAFYFKRDNTVYDVMLPQKDESNNENAITVSGDGSDGLYWISRTISASTTSSVTVPETRNAHVGGLVRINGTIYKISNVNNVDSPTVISINGTLDTTVNYAGKTAEFALANVVDNTIRESATETARSVTKKYGYGYEAAPLNDDHDRMIEYLAKDGSWTASINSKNIPDGPVEIHCVAFDKAGNLSTKVIPAKSNENPNGLYVSNNAPRIAGAIIKIDYNGNGVFTYTENEVEKEEDGEIIRTYQSSSISATSKTSTSAGGKAVYDPDAKNSTSQLNPLKTEMNIGSSNKAFAVLKGKTVIEPEIVGGNGKIYYAYSWKKHGSSTEVLSGHNPTAIITAGTEDYTVNAVVNPVTVQVGDLLLAGEATDKTQPDCFQLTFYDSTNGSEGFDSSNQNAKLNLYVGVNVQSGGNPSAAISPLYWKSLDDNSIVKQENVNTGKTELKGHIELSGDYESTDRNNWGSGLTDDDDKVSGEIMIEGTAEDSGRIIGLYFAIDGMDLSSITDKKTIGTGDSAVNYYNLTTLTNNVLTGNSALYDTNGVNVEVENEYTEEKHSLKWKLIWNTNKINRTEGTGDSAVDYNSRTDVKVRVLAVNQGVPVAVGKKTSESGYSAETHKNPGLDGETYYPDVSYPDGKTGNAKFTKGQTEQEYFQVDVVPYVTGLTTQLTKADPDNPSVYGRSALGSYPVYYYSTHRPGKDTENEEIVVQGYNLKNGKVYFSHDGADDVTADLFDKSSDGKLVITRDKSAETKVYNLPASAKSGVFTVKTGDIEVLNNKNKNDAKGQWNKSVAANTLGTYAVYKGYYNRQPNDMNNNQLTDDLDITIWDLNAQAIGVTSDLTRPVMHVNPNNGLLGFAYSNGNKFYMPNGNDSSFTHWSTAWNAFNSIGFTYDTKGNTFGVEMGTDSNKKTSSKFRIVASKWGTAGRYEYGNYHALRLESHHGNATRYDTHPKLVATNPDDDNANVYLMYYDPDSDDPVSNNNPGDKLKLRCGTIPLKELKITNGGSNLDKAAQNTTDKTFGDFYDDAYHHSIYEEKNGNKDTTPYNPTNYAHCSVVANKGSTYKPGTNYSLAVVPKGTIPNGKTAASDATTTDTLVTVWVDPNTDTLVYGYLENPLVNSHKHKKADGTVENSADDGTINNMWQHSALDTGNAGGYCAIAVDTKGGIHIAYYSKQNNGSLKYIYKSSYSDTGTTYTVDSYGATGKYLTIDFAKVGDIYVPYIGYYTSMKKPKYAYLKSTARNSGVDANSMFNSNWEVMCIPTMSSVDAAENIQIGVYRNADGTRKSIAVNNTNVGGNGTDNPIVGYATSYIGNGYMETAQIK